MHNLIMINKKGKCEKRDPMWQFFKNNVYSTQWINGYLTQYPMQYTSTNIGTTITVGSVYNTTMYVSNTNNVNTIAFSPSTTSISTNINYNTTTSSGSYITTTIPIK